MLKVIATDGLERIGIIIERVGAEYVVLMSIEFAFDQTKKGATIDLVGAVSDSGGVPPAISTTGRNIDKGDEGSAALPASAMLKPTNEHGT